MLILVLSGNQSCREGHLAAEFDISYFKVCRDLSRGLHDVLLAHHPVVAV